MSPELSLRLRELARKHERTVAEIVRDAVEMHFGEAAEAARSRLVDRLARLEAGLGDRAVLEEQIVAESRTIRVAARRTDVGSHEPSSS